MTEVQVNSQSGSQMCCEAVFILIKPLVQSEELVFPRLLWYRPGVFNESRVMKLQIRASAHFFFFFFLLR